MKKPNRISMSLFDEELKALINASAKIFPITQNDVDTNNNPGGYEYGRVDNYIYRWNNDKWEYIIADDKDILWEEIKNKPTSYVPKEHAHSELHTHANKSLLDTITESMINLWNSITNKADKTYVDTELEKKSDVTHNHDAVYSKLNHTHDYSPTTHTHDDRYYTESEIDTKLLNKADSAHNHDGAYYKKSEVDSKLGGKANTSHKHSESDIIDLDKYTTLEVDNLLSNKADVGHTHTELDIHINDDIIHISQQDRECWDSKSPFKYEEEFLELRNHYGYMNINGGDFDGNDGYYLMIDGGVF